MGIMEQLNQPVDMQAEIKAYEENEARDRGEEVPGDMDPEAALEAEPPEQSPSADPDPAHPDEPITDKPQHQGNAWKAMRERIKKAEDEARSVREEMARREGEQRAWQVYHAQQQAALQQQQQEQPIDPTVNPIEAMQRLQQDTQQMRQYIQQQQLIGEVQRAYRADADQFRTQKPDYNDAYNHAVKARVFQLELNGIPREQAIAQTHNEEMQLAYHALQQGRSPAAVMWEYATQIYGYQPKAGQNAPAIPGNLPRNDRGQFVSIEQEQRKAAAATSLSGQGRQPEVRTSFNVERGAQTNGSEFDKFYDQLKAEATKAEGKKKIEWR